MFPRLSDLINYLFGTHVALPFQTYGFMLALGFLAGGMVLRSELKRKEREGRLPGKDDERRTTDDANRKRWAGRDTIHPHQHTWSILVVALVSAIVGSKLFDLLDHFGAFLRDPVGSLFSFGGFAFLGGLLATVPALILYMRVIRLDWKEVIDCSAPAILAGYAVGRLGCHLAGDGCWGVINTLPPPEGLAWLPDWLWACRYPHNVINAGIPIAGCGGAHCRALAEPVFPTSLYESILSCISFLVIWVVRKRIQAPVVLFGLFLILFGAARLAVEQIRINPMHAWLGMRFTQAEAISLFLILTGAGTMVFFSTVNRSRHEK